MIVFLLLYIALCLYGIRFCREKNTEYLSIEQTTSVKGIFILLVFFSHFNSYVTYTESLDQTYASFVIMFGQTMVTLFLFYSGYGVMQSIMKKDSYIDTIPVKRILNTWIRFDCAVLIYLIIGLVSGKTFGLKQILLSFTGWDSVGNSNWYIFVILLLYAMTYCSFKIIRTKHLIWPVLAVIGMSAGWIALCALTDIKEIHWYDTILCYGAGMLYSLYKEKIEKFLCQNIIRWAIFLVLAFAAFVKLRGMGTTVSILLLNLIFTGIVVLFTMHIKIGNKVLYWCGKNLFELYILQRIPMMLLQYLGLHQMNIYVYFIGCIVITILLVKPFKYCCDKLCTLLLTK